MKHYLAMSGTRGCLPDYLQAHDRWSEAVADLARLFELTPQATTLLRVSGWLYLNSEDGAEYCAIETCDCAAAHMHEAG